MVDGSLDPNVLLSRVKGKIAETGEMLAVGDLWVGEVTCDGIC